MFLSNISGSPHKVSPFFIVVSIMEINMKPPRIAVYLTYLEDLTKMSIHLKYQKINFRDILVKQFYRFL